MDDWEAEDFQPLPAKVVLKSNSDKEDVDENDIKDSWEEADEPVPAPVVKPATEKAPKKAAAAKEETLDHIAEKLRMQRYNIETFHSYICFFFWFLEMKACLESGNAEAHFIEEVKQYFALD
ncbi:hypothetical protein Bca4012_027386 [Brassica carinata]